MSKRIFAELAAKEPKPERLMINATHLKGHRTAARLFKRGCSPTYRTHKGRFELKVPCPLRRQGATLLMLLSESQMNDNKGAALIMDAPPKANGLLGDLGYDANWFRQALIATASPHAFYAKPTARSRFPTTSPSIASVTRSKTRSGDSRTGDAFTPVTTDAPTPSFPRSALLPRHSHGDDDRFAERLGWLAGSNVGKKFSRLNY